MWVQEWYDFGFVIFFVDRQTLSRATELGNDVDDLLARLLNGKK